MVSPTNKQHRKFTSSAFRSVLFTERRICKIASSQMNPEILHDVHKRNALACTAKTSSYLGVSKKVKNLRIL